MNAAGAGQWQAFSAGSTPTGTVHPMALATLKELGLPHTGYRSKSGDEFAGPQAPEMDQIVTVCDNAAGEPVRSGRAIRRSHIGRFPIRQISGQRRGGAGAFPRGFCMIKKRLDAFLATEGK